MFMYTYLRLACLGSTIALTSLATPAYAMDPDDESEAVSQGAIMIHGHAYPALSQEQQETLRDLVTQKDALWEAFEEAESDEPLRAYYNFMSETFKPEIEPMMASLRKQYYRVRKNYENTFAKQMPLTSLLPAIQSWKDKNSNASSKQTAEKMRSLYNDRIKQPRQDLLDRGKKTLKIGSQLLALEMLQRDPPFFV